MYDLCCGMCFYFWSWSIIGSLCIGAIFAMAVIGLYYLYYDNSTKRIYAFFSLLGLLLFIQFLVFMGMDYRWISYIFNAIYNCDIEYDL